MQEIKLSAPDWCFCRKEFAAGTYYRKLRASGFCAVEMALAERWDALRNAGLKLINISAPGMRAGLNNRNNHSSLIPQIINTINLAAENVIPNVIIFSSNLENITDSDGLDNCKQAVEKLLTAAQANNVTLIFEMLNRYDHEDYQADNSNFGFKLVKSFDSANLKILYDIYHMHRMGENVIGDIASNLEYIAHLHVAGSPERNFPGDLQEIDYPAIITAVMNSGYNGCQGMEFTTTAPLKDLERVDALWKKILKRLIPRQFSCSCGLKAKYKMSVTGRNPAGT